MKKLILWLIKIFRLDIPTEKTVYLPQNGVIDGDITIKGNVLVTGNLTVEGGLTCYKEV